MNLNKLKTLYSNSPYFLKRLYSYIPFSFRNGAIYRKWRSHLNSGISMQRNPMETVKYAYFNFNFYKTLYKNINIDDWENIPLIDKHTIQPALKEFERFDVSKLYVTTGGVTGKPAKFYQSNNVWFKELAYVYDYFSLFGYTPNSLKASFRGGDFSKLKKGCFWLYNPNYNEVHFSPFHLNKDSISEYVLKMNKLKPKYFHGYPSAFMTLAKLMLNANLKLNYQPNTFFLISEGYKKKDIIFLKNFFNCKISSFYGHSERLVFAIADNKLEKYTPNLDYGYLELIDEDGKLIKENNIEGEIVATSYDNLAMPLIRYKTGDFTYYTDFKTKTFGLLKGKWGQTCLFGKNGEEITLTALNLHSKELDSILKVQFVQTTPGEVKLLTMFSDFKDRHQVIKIEKLLSSRVGELISFSIVITDNFQLNERGKAPLIINEIL